MRRTAVLSPQATWPGDSLGAGLAAAFLGLAAGCDRPTAGLPAHAENASPAAAAPVAPWSTPSERPWPHASSSRASTSRRSRRRRCTPASAATSASGTSTSATASVRIEVLAELHVPEMEVGPAAKGSRYPAGGGPGDGRPRHPSRLPRPSWTARSRSTSGWRGSARRACWTARMSMKPASAFEAAKANLERAKADVAAAEAQVEGGRGQPRLRQDHAGNTPRCAPRSTAW